MSRSVYSTILGIFLAVSLILPITLLAANPTIISLTPDSGPVGTQVQISGSGFGLTQGTSTVTFNGTSATASSWSDTQITATVPTAATTGAVKVTVGGIGSNTNVFFTVPGPQVTGISPTSGAVGTQVTVNGSGFQATKGSSSIAFNGTGPTVNSWSDTQIVATAVAGTTTGGVKVTVNSVASNQNVIFTLPNPVVASLVPSSGPAGTQVQINGSGFGAAQGTSNIPFNGPRPTVNEWSNSQIVATVPTTAISGPVKVTEGGVGSNASIFFSVPAPHITSASPMIAGPGFAVTINGSAFQASQASSSVTFNGRGATVSSWSDTQIVALIPSSASTGPLQLKVNH